MRKSILLTAIAGAMLAAGFLRVAVVADDRNPKDNRFVADAGDDSPKPPRANAPPANTSDANTSDANTSDAGPAAKEAANKGVAVALAANGTPSIPPTGRLERALSEFDKALSKLTREAKDGKTLAKRAAAPHREAVIDVAYVFKKLKRFKEGSDNLKREVQKLERAMRASQKEIRLLQDQVKKASGKARQRLEERLAAHHAAIQSHTVLARKRAVDAEASLYRTTYLQLQQEVAALARERGILIVRRADHRSQNGNLSGNPKQVIQALNRQVVYLADDAMDITDEILRRMNGQPVVRPRGQLEEFRPPAKTGSSNPSRR